MNEHSSRSHAIFLIFVECSEVNTGSILDVWINLCTIVVCFCMNTILHQPQNEDYHAWTMILKIIRVLFLLQFINYLSHIYVAIIGLQCIITSYLVRCNIPTAVSLGLYPGKVELIF